jgi:hypothetical protein
VSGQVEDAAAVAHLGLRFSSPARRAGLRRRARPHPPPQHPHRPHARQADLQVRSALPPVQHRPR